MNSSLRGLNDQLRDVDQRLQVAWLAEREEARRRVVELAIEFQLKPDTLARDVTRALHTAPAPHPALRVPRVDLPFRRPDAPAYVAPKYRNPLDGATWSGRGTTPRWLRDQVDAGRALEDFLIEDTGLAQSTPNQDPLRQFQDAASRKRRGRRS